MTRVHLRKKKLKNGKLSLFLDFWPPLADGSRREFLRLYLHAKPSNQSERDFNKETLMIAENIHAQKQLDLQAGSAGVVTPRMRQRNFIAYAESFVSSKAGKSTHRNYISLILHLKKFSGAKLPISAVDAKFCESFRDHLLRSAGLAHTSAQHYNILFRSIVLAAVRDRLISINPLSGVKGIETKETHREFLSLEELKALAKADCPRPQLKAAGLFSALTGLRWSDIFKLTWGEVQHSSELGYHVRFKIKKTGQADTLPISEEAVELLGERIADGNLVFEGLKKWHLQRYLPKWLENAGITRHVTFHPLGRHTYSVLQIDGGTDLYTLQKMLGHQSIKVTQRYAKLLDVKKREAAGRISLR